MSLPRELRRRRARLRLRPQIRYDLRWEPELDCCTGQSGYGLLAGLRLWWQLRRGTWKDDDWAFDFDWDDAAYNQPEEGYA